MNFKPILIVPGEKKSIFFEIFFKSIKLRNFSSPIVLICNKKAFLNEKRKFRFSQDIEEINLDIISYKKFKKKRIYIIDIKDKNSDMYVKNCFKIAFNLIKIGFTNKMINGPIDKTKTLKKKYLGITEFVAKKFDQKKFAMLIYNKELSVCPVTTHLPLSLVTKKNYQKSY